jgi:hypothetical protein
MRHHFFSEQNKKYMFRSSKNHENFYIYKLVFYFGNIYTNMFYG